jgi:hypothetical protein
VKELLANVILTVRWLELCFDRGFELGVRLRAISTEGVDGVQRVISDVLPQQVGHQPRVVVVRGRTVAINKAIQCEKILEFTEHLVELSAKITGTHIELGKRVRSD